MQSILLNLASALVGVLATVIVGRYFFKKSVVKRLTPFIQFGAPILDGMDPDVRRELKILYRGKDVEDIYELQFAVVNDGERPITDCVEPLTLHVAAPVEVLDASVLRSHPDGRGVDCLVESAIAETLIRLPFLLLNRGDGFVVKVIMRGRVSRNHLRFTIAAEDLPPIIEPQLKPPEWLTRRFASPLTFAGFIGFIALAALSAYAAYVLSMFQPALFFLQSAPRRIPVVQPLLLAWLILIVAPFVTAAIIYLAEFPWFARARRASAIRLPGDFWRYHDPDTSAYDIFFTFDETEPAKQANQAVKSSAVERS